MGGWIFWIVVIGVFIWYYKHTAKKNKEEARRRAEALAARKQALMDKYNDVEVVDKIINKYFWQGQTEAMLLDSLGQPADIDQKVMKSKTKDVWKYDEIAKNRFALKVTLEDGIVVGWDKK